jgi:threonyl-tRNA synthetase
MRVELPDGTPLELPDGATGADAAAAIGPGLARAALAVKVDGEVRDLSRQLPPVNGRPEKLEVITQKSGRDALDLIRHDAAHVLATAVLELYPGVKISIGPPIEDGFYYDFEFPDGVALSEADFEQIEAKMREHIAADEPFVREEVTAAQARERFAAEGQEYKVELIDDLVRNADPAHPVETVSLYTNGPFTDLCRGPHAPSTNRIKAFKLQSVAGAYWRGDAANKMLTRVYGTAFFSNKELEEYLERLERARANDHRRLGPQLGLFNFSEVAPGAAFWLPAGTEVFNSLVELSREMGRERGYTEVKTPQLYDSSLWKTSGHWDKFREHMFVTEYEDREMGLKPMNCPGHCKLFSLTQHSYRDLPVRYFEPGLLHRREPSGTLHGLLRVRHFAQDDSHIYCTEDQIQDEVGGVLEFAFATYKIFDLDVRLELSTRPEQRIGSDELWDKSEEALKRALEGHALEYDLNEGEGAFYGPKIDMHITDSLGRSWQLGTCQLDYNMPERFDLTYTGADNAEHRPVMIHRALMGSYERFIGILLEHLGGELPTWLTPVQAIVLPIADRHVDYGGRVLEELSAAGIRAELDDRTESMGRKIRDAELRKIPYMLVVGDRESEGGEVAVREHGAGDKGSLTVEEFAEQVSEKVKTRS